MITFRQFLLEDSPVDLIQFLKKNCLPACNDIAATGKFLGRGMTKAEGMTFVEGGTVFNGGVLVPKNNRKPKDTPEWAHNLFDKYFDSKFGVKLRSKAVFASKDSSHALDFGKLHIVIPMGKYDIYYSNHVRDLTTYIFPDFEAGEDPGLVGGYDYWIDKVGGFDKWVEKSTKLTQQDQEELLNQMLDKAWYKKGPNADALRTNYPCEYMVMCDRYLAISLFNDDDVNIHDKLLEVIDEVVS